MKIAPSATRSTICTILATLLFEKAIQVALEEGVILPHRPRLLFELVGDDDGGSLIDHRLHTAIDIVLDLGERGRVDRQRLHLLLFVRREDRGYGVPDLAGDAPLLLRFEKSVAYGFVLADPCGSSGDVRGGASIDVLRDRQRKLAEDQEGFARLYEVEDDRGQNVLMQVLAVGTHEIAVELEKDGRGRVAHGFAFAGVCWCGRYSGKQRGQCECEDFHCHHYTFKAVGSGFVTVAAYASSAVRSFD